jgi:hypothetical protein
VGVAAFGEQILVSGDNRLALCGVDGMEKRGGAVAKDWESQFVEYFHARAQALSVAVAKSPLVASESPHLAGD